MITLGSKVRVTDPCYHLDTWCAATIENVEEGEYNTRAIYDKETDRVAEILAVHQKYDINKNTKLSWEKTHFDIGVDSGQCGIFNYFHFKEEKDKDDAFEEEHGTVIDSKDWHYGRCCIGTGTDDKAAEIDGLGYVSQSGYGDGSYDLYVAKNERHRIIAFKIVFIEDEEVEEIDNGW